MYLRIVFGFLQCYPFVLRLCIVSFTVISYLRKQNNISKLHIKSLLQHIFASIVTFSRLVWLSRRLFRPSGMSMDIKVTRSDIFSIVFRNSKQWLPVNMQNSNTNSVYWWLAKTIGKFFVCRKLVGDFYGRRRVETILFPLIFALWTVGRCRRHGRLTLLVVSISDARCRQTQYYTDAMQEPWSRL